jgi:myo-inositol 2-dehydrogenase / D-chiro-inositol 1-dehydrogenase
MGRVHLTACANSDSVRVTAIADTSGQVREDLAAEGFECFGNADDLVDSGVADAAIIATPTPTHQELTAKILAAGLPVLCEKPCGPTAAGMRDLAAMARSHRSILRVGYWRRFVPELTELHDQIRRGQFGTLLSLETGQWDQQPPIARYQLECGTIFADMAVHDLDQIQWLAGERVTTVRAVVRTVRSSQPPEAALVVLALDSGLIAAASLGRWFPGGDACWLRVHGTAGFRDLRFLWPPRSDEQMAAAVRTQDEAFAALVQGNPDPRLATAADAEAALAAAEAAATAAAAGPASLGWREPAQATWAGTDDRDPVVDRWEL